MSVFWTVSLSGGSRSAVLLSLVDDQQAKIGVVEQATTILLITLEIAYSKAKSECF